ncbi:MAG TPA: iron-containing alcohol dehydrogenase [Verrucomicrobiales bacterium]|nr:iron-containing alcohol dehydrogenase [Verrucomicrobiales bacterium]
MKKNWASFEYPTEIIFGNGRVCELKKRLQDLGVSRPLVVTDSGLRNTEAFRLTSAALGESLMDSEWFLFAGVHSNPIEQDVKDAAEVFRSKQCDGIVALGGGSALDVGKAARLLIADPSLELADFDYRLPWESPVPSVAIPTTAGTGSELGRSSVITLPNSHRKALLFHPHLMPDLVIADPELTRGLPPKLTAATGVDALTHCIESFTSPVFHPFCDGIALEGIHLIVEALPRACRDGGDLEARGMMLTAASMGGIAFHKDLGATHSLAHPLSALCGLHHGTANALCLSHVMAFNAERKPGTYRRVGISCGLDLHRDSDVDADHKTIEFITGFLTEIGLTEGLRAYGVKESDIEALSQQAVEDSCHLTNPVPVSIDDLKALYRKAL